MNWLAVDTSMNACGVAVKRTDGVFFSKIEAMERGQAERLMPMILEVLAQAGLTLADIDSYAIVNGPGTFTGLRVGLATVRALAQASNKPAVGVGTFDVLAEMLDDKPLCVLIETKRTDYYVRAPGHADGCMSPEDLKAIIKPEWTLVGDAVMRAVKELDLKNKTWELKSAPLDRLLLIAANQTPHGYPEPVYLRGADVSRTRKKAVQII